MSKWTGKCDFQDTCNMYNPTQILHAKVYMENARIDFKNDYTNVIPYYPHIVASMAASKSQIPFWTGLSSPANDKIMTFIDTLDLSIYLKKDDYFDDRERESKAIALNELVYKIQNTKKNKMDYKSRVSFIDYWKHNDKLHVLNDIEEKLYNKSTDDQLSFLASLKIKFDSNSINCYWAIYKAIIDEWYYSVKVDSISKKREEFYNYCVEQSVSEDNPKFRELKLKVSLSK